MLILLNRVGAAPRVQVAAVERDEGATTQARTAARQAVDAASERLRAAELALERAAAQLGPLEADATAAVQARQVRNPCARP